MLTARISTLSAISGMVSGMMLFLLLMGALWIQVTQIDRQEARDNAQAFLESTDRILDEANPVLAAIRMMNGGTFTCSDEHIQTINQLVAEAPHIRSAALVRQGKLICSSVSGRTSQPSLLAGVHPVSLAVISVPSGKYDERLLFRVVHVPKGLISASFPFHFIQENLRLLSARRDLYFFIGEARFSRDGMQYPAENHPTRHWQLFYSTRYPYAVGYIIRHLLPTNVFIQQNRYLLLLLGILSTGVGILIYRLGNRKFSSPVILKKAILRGEIKPYLQAVTRADGTIFGAEILARWNPPGGNAIGPDIFIPVAEENGLLPLLTKCLLQQTGDFLRNAILPEGFHLGVNISTRQFSDPELAEVCRAFLKRFPSGNIRLVAELTERTPLYMDENMRKTLSELEIMGVDIALDDFGTGYSGLYYIRILNASMLKIDKSFTGMLTGKDADTRLVESVVDIARRFDMEIIAEGVENPWQVTWLSSRGITLYQGWLFSRPLPAEEFIERWLG